MSKRHQSSRRKSYGRRQHEIHERTPRREPDADSSLDLQTEVAGVDEPQFHGYAGPSARLGFALSD